MSAILFNNVRMSRHVAKCSEQRGWRFCGRSRDGRWSSRAPSVRYERAGPRAVPEEGSVSSLTKISVAKMLLKQRCPLAADAVDQLEPGGSATLCLECFPEDIRSQIVRVQGRDKSVGTVLVGQPAGKWDANVADMITGTVIAVAAGHRAPREAMARGHPMAAARRGRVPLLRPSRRAHRRR